MKKYSFALFSMLLISAMMVFSPITQADSEGDLSQREQVLNARERELNQREQELNQREQSYGAKVGWKALGGFVNVNTAVLEIPKNIINVTNESNLAFGFIGGTAKGILNTVGRMMTGFSDILLAPLPTKPSLSPTYIWQDFDVDTTYGEVFRVDNQPSQFDLGKPD